MTQPNKSFYSGSGSLESEPKDSEQASTTLEKQFPNTVFSENEVTRKAATSAFVGGMSAMMSDTPLGTGFRKNLVDSTDSAGVLLYDLGSNIDESEPISDFLSNPNGVVRIAANGPASLFDFGGEVGNVARAHAIKTTAPNVPGWLQGLGFELQNKAKRIIKEQNLEPEYQKASDQFLNDLGAGGASMAMALGLGMLTAEVVPAVYFGMIQKAQTFKEMTQTVNLKDLKTGEVKQASFMDKATRDNFEADIQGRYLQNDISKDGRYQLVRPPMDPKTAGAYSTIAAIPEAGLEFIGLNRMIHGLRGYKPLTRIFLAAGTEAIQEASQQGSEEILAKMGWNRPGSMTDLAKRVGYSALLGFLLGVPGGAVTTFAMNRGVRGEMIRNGMSEKEADRIIKKWSERVIELGEGDAEILIRELLDTPGVSFQEQTPIFVSALEDRLQKRMPENASVEQVMGIIREGIKQEEIETSGIIPFLAGKDRVNKKELIDLVQTNRIEIEEVEKEEFSAYKTAKRNASETDFEDFVSEMQNKYKTTEWLKQADEKEKKTFEGLSRQMEEAEHAKSVGETKFQNYQLPGGEHYKELLLTLPVINQSKEKADLEGKKRAGIMDRTEQDRAAEREKTKENFKSSHFNEPNILAHVRFNDRLDSEGNKVLFIEEIQSDWHQMGRKIGYGGMVPEAPFKKTWHELVLKRMIRYAVDNGFNKIAWTTGDQQVERYDLSKQIDTLSYDKKENGKIDIGMAPKGFRNLEDIKHIKDVNPKDLENYVGKDLANKIIEAKDPQGQMRGVDLKVGGEGLKTFYDEIITNFLNKYSKRFGGKVSKSTLQGVFEENGVGFHGEGMTKFIKDNTEISPVKVHSLEITDEMKKSVMEGQPLFQQGSKSEKISKKEALDQWNKLKDKLPFKYHAVFADLAKNDFHAFTSTLHQLILLTKDLKATTVPHEAFHAIFEGVLSDFERQVLREEVFLKTGLQDKLEQEEWLAEQFAHEWLGREERTKTLGGRIQQFIKDIAAFIKNFIANIDNIEAIFSGIAQKSFEGRVSEAEKKAKVRFQEKDPLQKAIDKKDIGGVIKQLGGFSYPEHLEGEIGEGEQAKLNRRKLKRYLNENAQGLDEMLQEAKTIAPQLFNKFATDADLLSAILSGEVSAKPTKQEKDYERAYEEFEKSKSELERLVEEAKSLGIPEEIINEYRQDAIESFRKRIESERADLKFAAEKALGETLDSIELPGKANQLELIRQEREEKFVPGEQIYEQNRRISKPTKYEILRKDAGVLGTQVGESFAKYTIPISTRLREMSPGLRSKLRRFEFELMNQILQDEEAVLPFLKTWKSMSESDRADLDLALKNGDVNKRDDILKKYKQTYDAVRVVLDDLYERAKGVNLDVGYLENFHPRSIKDSEGFLAYIQRALGKDWSIIEEALRQRATEIDRALTEDEKAELVNTLLRGYENSQITLSKPGALKERNIELVTPELNQFYYESGAALMNYIYGVNDSIQSRKFFGKWDHSDKNHDNLEGSIGAFVLDLLEKGEIRAEQEVELSEILKARFNEHGTHGMVSLVKNLTYMYTMGSPASAITQIGDLAFALYRYGFYDTGRTLSDALAGKSKFTKEDIATERIADEFTDQTKSGAALSFMFKTIGLEWMDRIGKQTIINAAYEKYSRLAHNPTPEFKAMLEEIFPEKGSIPIMNYLREGYVNDDIKFLLFSELSDFQPITPTEMPEGYLNAGNWRILYMLKSYMIKQIDVFRNEAFRDMKTDPKKGMTNLIRLAAFLIMMNATADVLKDLLLGRKTYLSDLIIDNMVRLGGFSKYTFYQAKTDGLATAIQGFFIPPVFKFPDDIRKDVTKAATDKLKGPEKLETIQGIPYGGKLFYWWFGAGRDKEIRTARRKARGKRKSGFQSKLL